VTLFFISKSDDENRVDYGMRLDSKCAPYGDESVFPYWREFEPLPPVRTSGRARRASASMRVCDAFPLTNIVPPSRYNPRR
jgi:hypothetical protein